MKGIVIGFWMTQRWAQNNEWSNGHELTCEIQVKALDAGEVKDNHTELESWQNFKIPGNKSSIFPDPQSTTACDALNPAKSYYC